VVRRQRLKTTVLLPDALEQDQIRVCIGSTAQNVHASAGVEVVGKVPCAVFEDICSVMAVGSDNPGRHAALFAVVHEAAGAVHRVPAFPTVRARATAQVEDTVAPGSGTPRLGVFVIGLDPSFVSVAVVVLEFGYGHVLRKADGEQRGRCLQTRLILLEGGYQERFHIYRIAGGNLPEGTPLLP